MSSQKLHTSVPAAIVNYQNLMIAPIVSDRLHHRWQELLQQMTPFPVEHDDAGPTLVGLGERCLSGWKQKKRRSRDVCKKQNDSDQKIERKEQEEEPVAIAQPGPDPVQNPIHRSL